MKLTFSTMSSTHAFEIWSLASRSAEAWTMFEADLAERRPDFILDTSPGDVAYYGAFTPDHFPVLARALRCHYRDVATVDVNRIFKRLAMRVCDQFLGTTAQRF